MAPAASASTSKPKRKRQRNRKQQVSSGSSSSDTDSSSDEEAPVVVAPVKLATPEASSSSSSEASSSSSEEESSDEDVRGRRRGKNGLKGKPSTAAASGGSGLANGTTASAQAARRPYPSRSPSPAAFNPANIPLGLNQFPLLKSLNAGPILASHVPGDAGFGGEVAGDDEQSQKRQEDALSKEAKFGDWWRARLVSEFEKELGGLAAEPGLTPARLSLLLTSLTTLSSLHTTSATPATTSTAPRSIWLHDPNSAIDPLAALELEEGGEEWGKATIGGAGDVEAGEQGVDMDAQAAAAAGSTAAPVEAMEVDE